MSQAIDLFVRLLADFTEAQSVVLYREKNGFFEPASYFTLSRDFTDKPFDERDSNIVARVLREWSPLITSDATLLEEVGVPYYSACVPRVFMAVPFKLGRDRAVLCLDSSSLVAFSEKQQRLVNSSVELIKSIDQMGNTLSAATIPKAKVSFLEYTIKLFSSLPLEGAFEEWASSLDVEYAGFFVLSEGELRPLVEYTASDASDLRELSTEVPARSALRLAIDRDEVYCFSSEKARFFGNYEAYGLLVPVRSSDIKGLLVITSQDPGHFTEGVLDVFESAARIIFLMVKYKAGKWAKDGAFVDPLEVENRLRILTSRVKKEGRLLGLVLFTVRNVDREIAKRGLWRFEKRMLEIMSRFSKLSPMPDFVVRLSDNAVVVAATFDSYEDALIYKREFNTSIADLVDFKDCGTELLVYPEDFSSVEDLLSALSDKVARSKKKSWI